MNQLEGIKKYLYLLNWWLERVCVKISQKEKVWGFFCQNFNTTVSYLAAFQWWLFILGLASDNSISNLVITWPQKSGHRQVFTHWLFLEATRNACKAHKPVLAVSTISLPLNNLCVSSSCCSLPSTTSPKCGHTSVLQFSKAQLRPIMFN